MKFTCIIDACSFISLNNCTLFKEKNALKLLIKNTEVIFTPAVNLEIRDHYNNRMPSLAGRKSYVSRTKAFSLPEFERRVFGNNLGLRHKNKGERDNLCLLIDQFVHFKRGGLVFLTDDENALRGILNGKIDAFPTHHIWSSHDAIIYLYILKEIPSMEFALDAIRELDNIIAPHGPNTTPEKTQQKLNRIKKYRQNIEFINNLI